VLRQIIVHLDGVVEMRLVDDGIAEGARHLGVDLS